MGNVDLPDDLIRDVKRIADDLAKLKRSAGQTRQVVNTSSDALPTPVNGRWLFATGGVAVWSDLPAASTVTDGITKKGVANSVAQLDAGVLVPFAQMGTGSASGAKFLRDDRAWSILPAASTTVDGVTKKGVASSVAELDATTRVPVAQLGTGTPTGVKFLRDDRVFAVPAGGGGGSDGGASDFDGVAWPHHPSLIPGVATVGAANNARFVRMRMPTAGTLDRIQVLVGTASGNMDAGISDVGLATSGVHTFLWRAGSTAVSAAGTGQWQVFTVTGVTVTSGQLLDFWIACNNNVATFGRAAMTVAAAVELGTIWDALEGPGCGARIGGGDTASFALPATKNEGALGTGSGFMPFVMARIT